MALTIGNNRVTPKTMARQLIFNAIKNMDAKEEPHMSDATLKQVEEVERFVQQEIDRWTKAGWNKE